MTIRSDVVIVGAGMAGASAAYFLSGRRSVTVLERESAPAYHSTGRSAAQFTVGIAAATMRHMAEASRAFFATPPEGFAARPILTQRGSLKTAAIGQEAELKTWLDRLVDVGADAHHVDAAEALRLFPALRPDDLAGGVWEPDAQDIDVDLLLQGYLRGAKANGARFVMDAGVDAIERRQGEWVVTTPAGMFAAPILVNASGAWGDVLAGMAGVATIGLVPHRRTAFTFAPPPDVDISGWPHVNRLGGGWYVKPEPGRFMGSLSDATPTEPCDAQPEDIDVAQGIDNIERDTTLRIARPASTWAGLRSFVRDTEPVAGFAADAEGFFWLAGQGGCGILTSPAMGAAVAALVCGGDLPAAQRDLGLAAADLSPGRATLRAGAA